MVLLFFKVFSTKMYSLLYALKPIVGALFPLRLRHLRNMVLKRFNSISWRRKSLITHFDSLFWCAEKKEIIGCQFRDMRRMTHQFAGLNWCVKARIVMVHNDLSSLARFSNFSEDFRQTSCGVPLRIDRPTKEY